jgi:hypothetical protein
MDAETVARELYALRPGEFVAARDEKVAEARRAGERELATEIKSMRRPTVSAWVTNLFAHERGERLEQLFSLGTALREAQASLSGETLRRLDEQRRQVIAALAGEASALAAERGQPVPARVVADVEQTLYAALADADAAASVKAGRLTTSLVHTGFGDLESTPATSARAGATTARDVKDEADGGADDRRREQLRDAMHAAERAVKAASRSAERAERQRERSRERRERCARAVEELETQLGDARSALSDAERDVTGADAELERAQAALDEARAAAESARSEAAQ